MRSFFSALCNVCHQRVVPEAPPQFPPKLHSLKGHRRATLFLIWASVSNSTMIPIWTKENSGLLRSQSSVTTALHSPIHKKVIRVTFECAMFLLFRSLRYSNLHCRKGAELCFSVFFPHVSGGAPYKERSDQREEGGVRHCCTNEKYRAFIFHTK